MTTHQTQTIEQNDSSAGWSGRMAFVLGAAGSAVGLGNVWKFPYITGENGGGAFVIVYLFCIALIGLPILAAEITLGRHGKANPVRIFTRFAETEGVSRGWQTIGWMGLTCAFLILSYYSVVAGWALVYLWHSLSGQFSGDTPDGLEIAAHVGGLFDSLLANPAILLLGHTLIMIATIAIVMKGIRGGVEKAVRVMVPGLIMIIFGLVIYAAVSTGQFGRSIGFMFNPDFSAMTWHGVLVAMGHAFFTLSVGMCAMMAYGSFLGRDVSIGKSAVAIAGLDTFIALMAGLAIFPIVFAHGLDASEGPGLVFVTLPIAFSEVPGGTYVALFFFLFLAMAALTSTISILEPVVEYLEYKCNWPRRLAALVTGGIIWLTGIGCALAFNLWSGFTIINLNFFDLFDFLSSNLLLPLGGMLTALFTGWFMTRKVLQDELETGDSLVFRGWMLLLRFVAPLSVGIVLVWTLYEKLGELLG